MSITSFLKRLGQGLVPLCLVLSLPAQATTQAAATRNPFLWRIDGKGDKTFAAKSWLFGTMHLGDERLVTLPESVEKALASIDAVYCELEMDQVQKQQQRMMRKMLLPEGRTLEDCLPERLYQRLSDHLEDCGASIDTFKRMQVWAMNLSLAAIEARKEKMTKALDMMIYKDAKAEDKEVGGLETLDEQLVALADMPEEDHVKMLDESLDYMEKLATQGVSAMRKMLEVYLTGDEDRLVAIASEAMGGDKVLVERFMKPMVFDRNERMADRMARLMAEHPQTSYFFAVGALHYPGKNGIVELLRKKGYQIQRIDAPKKAGTKPQPKSRPLERVRR